MLDTRLLLRRREKLEMGRNTDLMEMIDNMTTIYSALFIMSSIFHAHLLHLIKAPCRS